MCFNWFHVIWNVTLLNILMTDEMASKKHTFSYGLILSSNISVAAVCLILFRP